MKKSHIIWIKITLISLIVISLLSVVGFLIYVSDYYRAEEVALTVLTTENIEYVDDQFTILHVENASAAIIFYPGAKVEHTAYLPILELLRNEGITCVLVEMPFNMAIFDVDAADKIIDYLDEEYIYIAGHSMGGAMASIYAEENADKIDGAIMLGAYMYGEYDSEKSITIYGSLNDNLEENFEDEDYIIKIEGGNHAQFGNYGEQDGDTTATISAQEQQSIAVEAIVEFINKE